MYTCHVMYSRWTRYNYKDDVPTEARCRCFVKKTGNRCETKPKYYIRGTDAWACGRHLQESLPECSICLCAMSKKNEKRIACGHVFHTECLSRWEDQSINQSTRCPVCRAAYFSSGYRPIPLPEAVMVVYKCCRNTVRMLYDKEKHSDQVRFLTEAVLMEVVVYGYIPTSTVQEMKRTGGSEWYTSFRENFCAPILEDGTVEWSQMNHTHRTAELLRRLKQVL